MPANRMRPASRSDLNKARQRSGSLISSRTTCQARWPAKARRPTAKTTPAPAAIAGGSDEQHRKPVEQAEHGLGAFPEQKRGGLDADERVVLAILMGINRVVADHPGNRAGIEQQRRNAERAEGGGPTHQCAPGKRQSQHDLRPVCDAFHERVDRDDGERSDAKGNREAVEGDQHDETDQCLQQQKAESLLDADLPGRNGPRTCALNAAVEIAVDDVVPGAAGAAHRECTDKEERDVDEARSGAAGGDSGESGRPPAWQQ